MLTIFTSIYGGRDELHPPTWRHEDVRVICYTDDPKLKAKGVETIVEPRPVPCPARSSRYWKIFRPPSGDSIWIDGVYQLTGDPRPFVKALPARTFALVKHWKAICLYREAIKTAARNKDDPHTILRQALRYDIEGVPSNYGIWEGGIIIRRRRCPTDWQDLWWNEIVQGSCRDQLSLAYVLWKTGQKFVELTERPDCFTMHHHAEKVKPNVESSDV